MHFIDRESESHVTRLHDFIPHLPLYKILMGIRETSTTHQTDTHLCPFCDSEAIVANTYAPRSPNSTFNRFKIERFHFHNWGQCSKIRWQTSCQQRNHSSAEVSQHASRLPSFIQLTWRRSDCNYLPWSMPENLSPPSRKLSRQWWRKRDLFQFTLVYLPLLRDNVCTVPQESVSIGHFQTTYKKEMMENLWTLVTRPSGGSFHHFFTIVIHDSTI